MIYPHLRKKMTPQSKNSRHTNTLNSWYKFLHAQTLGNDFHKLWVMYNSCWSSDRHTDEGLLLDQQLWKISGLLIYFMFYVYEMTLLYLPTFILILHLRTTEIDWTVFHSSFSSYDHPSLTSSTSHDCGSTPLTKYSVITKGTLNRTLIF